MTRIVEVRPLDGYRIWLRFSDGTQGEVDLNDLAGRAVCAAWNDPNVFKAVQVEAGGGIEWPGEIDMCSDALYLRLTGKAVEDIFPSLKTTPVIDDELTAQERAELNASLDRALEDSDAGQGTEAWEYLQRYRADHPDRSAR